MKTHIFNVKNVNIYIKIKNGLKNVKHGAKSIAVAI